MQETIGNFLGEFKSRLTEADSLEGMTDLQYTVIDRQGNNYMKDCQYKLLFDKFFLQRTILSTVDKIEEQFRPRLCDNV